MKFYLLRIHDHRIEYGGRVYVYEGRLLISEKTRGDASVEESVRAHAAAATDARSTVS